VPKNINGEPSLLAS